ncbi:hypothetical protein PVAP13_4NG180922 [Panicum virgatum]|uniref:Uncharacterized protein n=1 Tax=Panicum virgatum TaxID=38727 RepID=A0A8T0TDW9_PANVG|nr:hypothetical protein PVAP13_4NG180922 [Panicum virgatum]
MTFFFCLHRFALQAESLSGFHAKTHIPVVVGGQMRYEVTGDLLYKEIAAFFLDTVNSSHAYATGGTSVNEFWSDPKRLAENLTTETQESCTTYNMLKVSRHLFRWTKEIAYADYYERALIPGVLSIQRGRDPGVMIYMLPQSPGSSKARSYHKWGTPYDSFWCCYGTGIESFFKLGDSIYFEEKGERPALYIIQFIPSTFNWRTAGLAVTLKLEPLSSSDQYLKVSLSISAKTVSQFATLNVRIPTWTSSSGAKATLNDKDLELISPGTFLTISKQWDSGDRLSLQLPIHLRTEAIKGGPVRAVPPRRPRHRRLGRQDRRRHRRTLRLDHPRLSGVRLPAGDPRARVRRQGFRALHRERLPDDAGAAQRQRRHRRRRPRDVQAHPPGRRQHNALDGLRDARAVGHAGDGGHGHGQAHGVREEELRRSVQRRAGARRRARLGVARARGQAGVLLGRRRQEGPGRLWRRLEARRRRRRGVPASGELRAGPATAAVPPGELRR